MWTVMGKMAKSHRRIKAVRSLSAFTLGWTTSESIFKLLSRSGLASLQSPGEPSGLPNKADYKSKPVWCKPTRSKLPCGLEEMVFCAELESLLVHNYMKWWQKAFNVLIWLLSPPREESSLQNVCQQSEGSEKSPHSHLSLPPLEGCHLCAAAGAFLCFLSVSGCWCLPLFLLKLCSKLLPPVCALINSCYRAGCRFLQFSSAEHRRVRSISALSLYIKSNSCPLQAVSAHTQTQHAHTLLSPLFSL